MNDIEWLPEFFCPTHFLYYDCSVDRKCYKPEREWKLVTIRIEGNSAYIVAIQSEWFRLRDRVKPETFGCVGR